MTALQADLACHGDADFRARVEYWMVRASVDVTTEAASANLHPDRLLLAQRILGDISRYLLAFALAAMTNATLMAYASVAVITDSDLQFAVNSAYNSFIGI